MNILKTTSVIILLFITTIITAQGPLDGYFKGRKVLDLAVSGGVQTANMYFKADGPFNYSRTLPMASVFAELGITDRLDVIATLPFINDKLQDIGLYAKVKMIDARLFSRPLTIAPGIGFSAPVSNYNTEIKNAIGQRATQFHGHLIAQTTLFGNVSLQIQGTYHYALDPVPSSITASSKLIYSKNSWYLDCWYEYQQGQGEITFGGPIPYSSFREFTVDYNRIGGVIYKGLDNNWGIFVNASTILNGLDTFNTTTVMGGFVKKFNILEHQKKRYLEDSQVPRNKFR